MEFGINSINATLIDGQNAWGARAIFKNGLIDLVGNRQSFQGSSPIAWQLMVNMQLPILRKKVEEMYWAGKLPSDEVVEILDEPGFRALVRAAGGYLYITAFAPRHSENLVWTGKGEIPLPGDKVDTQSGPGIVLAHFAEAGYLGLCVKYSEPPEWFTRQAKQGGYAPVAVIFGRELR